MKSSDYPPDWPKISDLLKKAAGWKCARCGVDHDPDPRSGNQLSVHHLDRVKWNCAWWNLLVTCQSCHLHLERKIYFEQGWLFGHAHWFRLRLSARNDAIRSGWHPGDPDRCPWPPETRQRALLRSAGLGGARNVPIDPPVESEVVGLGEGVFKLPAPCCSGCLEFSAVSGREVTT